MYQDAYTTRHLVDYLRSSRCIAEVLTTHDSAPLAFAVSLGFVDSFDLLRWYPCVMMRERRMLVG